MFFCIRSSCCSTPSAFSPLAPLPLLLPPAPRDLCHVSQRPQQPSPFHHHQPLQHHIPRHHPRRRRRRRLHLHPPPPLGPGPSNYNLAVLLMNRENDLLHTVPSPRSSAVRFLPACCYEPVCSECVMSERHGAELTPFGSTSSSSSSSSSYRAPSPSSYRVPCWREGGGILTMATHLNFIVVAFKFLGLCSVI
jgi:hypothetical protein